MTETEEKNPIQWTLGEENEERDLFPSEYQIINDNHLDNFDGTSSSDYLIKSSGNNGGLITSAQQLLKEKRRRLK